MFFRQEMKTDWIGRDFKTDVFCNSKFVDTCLEKKPSLLIDYERSVKIWMYTLPLSPQLMEKKTFRDGCESDCQSIIKTQGNASDLVYQTQVQ